MKKKALTINVLQKEATAFAAIQSKLEYKELFGITDGKAVGTFMELKFKKYLIGKYNFAVGNAASGIDFPELDVDIKVTSIKQPQSSSPYRSARQKIYGLGYSLLVFVYEKKDNPKSKKGNLHFLHTIFVTRERTADYQTTNGIINILENNANKDDLLAFIQERNLPVDEVEADKIAEELLKNKPILGYLTISNALQWRLQYSRIIQEAGNVNGIIELCRLKNERKDKKN